MSFHIWGPLSVTFLLGISWRLFSRASKAFRSKIRTYPSRAAFVKANWDVFLLRTFPFNSGLFVLWLWKPGLLSNSLTSVGVPGGFANWLTVTPNLLSSFAFGFLVDYGLDQVQIKLATMKLPAWVPEAFRGEIPSYDASVVNGAAFTQVNQRDTGLSTSPAAAAAPTVVNAPPNGDN